MHCTLCRKFGKRNAFATLGSTNFRRSALSDHTKSKDHVNAIRAEQDAKDAAPQAH